MLRTWTDRVRTRSDRSGRTGKTASAYSRQMGARAEAVTARKGGATRAVLREISPGRP